MPQKLNIVMFNMSRYADWQKGVNRNYHILHTLLKDERINKIIAVDFFPFNWKRAAKVFALDQVFGDARGEVVYGDLTSRCWQMGAKLLVYSTIDSMMRKMRITHELNRIIAEQGMSENLVIWSYNPLYTGYFGAFPHARYVFDAVDNWAEHSSYASRKGEVVANYRTIEEKSHLVFTVADELRGMFHNKPHVHWVANAVDPDHFEHVEGVSELLKNIPRPIIGFLGILQDRLDIDIFTRIAQDHPEKSLVLAGPVWKGFPEQKLKALGNVYFTGPVPYAEIPRVYAGFDVGIIPYKNNAFIRSTNSMKFYEYIAAGLPVVSTTCPGIEQFGDAIYRADTPEAFSAAVGKALREHTAARAADHKLVLKGKTWSDRIEEMLRLIYQQF